MSRASERLDRLAGDGKRGGGMPLPLLFGTVLDLLQEHDTRTIDDLKGPVEAAIRKPERLSMIYPGSDDPWGDFVRDGFEQMESRKIVAHDDGQWRLGPSFKAGERMIVIPARKGKNAQIGIASHPPGENAAREADERRKAELISAYALLRRNGPGLRKPDEKHIEKLVESIREFGWLKEFPVLVDQDDHILDGRHRLEAAKRAGKAHTELKVRVADPAEALAIALVANESKPCDKKNRQRLTGLLGAGISQKAKWALIEARLREHPEWSDNLIANKVGCDHKTVTAARSELESTWEFPKFDRLLGEDGKWRKNKRKPAAKPTNGTKAPALVEAVAEPPYEPDPVPVVEAAPAPSHIDQYKKWRAAGFDDREARQRAGYTDKTEGRGPVQNAKKSLADKLLAAVDAFVAETGTFMDLDEVLELVRKRWERRLAYVDQGRRHMDGRAGHIPAQPRRRRC